MDSTKLEVIKETLAENPFLSTHSLEQRLPWSNVTIFRYINELAKNGDKNAQKWKEIGRLKNSRVFGRALKLYLHVREDGMRIEDVEKMDVYSDILPVLKDGRYIGRKGISLCRVQEMTIQLMRIFEKLGYPSNEQIDYAIKAYGKNL
ncbi:MAG: hypothetical protein NTW30_00105 [Candidatus Aenigmarchaeota archaeon]|nr:hypothetical protein [Candidatus Aenigmarchaeota archaeon]